MLVQLAGATGSGSGTPVFAHAQGMHAQLGACTASTCPPAHTYHTHHTACVLSRVWLSVTPCMNCVAHQAPLSMGFSKQEYWSRLPFPPPEDPLNPGIKPVSCVSWISRQILYKYVTWVYIFSMLRIKRKKISILLGFLKIPVRNLQTNILSKRHDNMQSFIP